MDCNKEEANRAKAIAEEKMENKDFAGARRFATKAQNLNPELENIGQIICVCDVHCSAESRKLVNDKDWYSIIQVEQSADEVMIKKQYRKFALLLHPDKNKFHGAEAAFKLVEEAQRVLLDKEKRSFYDSKYRRFCHIMTPNNPFQPNKNPNVVKQPWGQAYTYNASSHVKFPPKYEASSAMPFATTGQRKEVGGSKRVNEKIHARKMNTRSSSAANPVKDTGKKGKKSVIIEVSSGSDSDSSSDHEQDAEVDKKPNGNTNLRRSKRNRARVSYNENGSDDDEIMKTNPANSAYGIGKDEFKKARGNEPEVEEKVKENEDAENGFESDDSDSEDEPQTFDVPDPEFSYSVRPREETPFQTGHVWAINDDQEGMPRVYAIIKRVLACGKRLKIRWLKADPDDVRLCLWVKKKLPYSCGEFTYGSKDIIGVDRFSHRMFRRFPPTDWKIYPKMKETWAIFSNWSPDWISKAEAGPGTRLKYKYQLVEVQIDFTQHSSICVCLLKKLEGFICVFYRDGPLLKISPDELLRFSHKVPSRRIERKKGIPFHSFELDPASLPVSLLSKS